MAPSGSEENLKKLREARATVFYPFLVYLLINIGIINSFFL